MANSLVTSPYVVTETGVLTNKPIKVTGIIFLPVAADDTIIIKNKAGGDVIFELRATNAYMDEIGVHVFSAKGLYVDTLTTDCKAYIYYE